MGKEMRDLIRGTVRDHRLVKFILNHDSYSQGTITSTTINQ